MPGRGERHTGEHLARPLLAYNQCRGQTGNGILLIDARSAPWPVTNAGSPPWACWSKVPRTATSSNIFTQCDTGVKLDGSDLNVLLDNDCSNNVISILLEDASNNTLEENLANNVPAEYPCSTLTTTAFAGEFCEECLTGICLSAPPGNTISADVFLDNIEYGIMLASSPASRILDNECQSQDFGVYLDGSDRNEIIGNDCDDNDYNGIALSYSNNNTIAGNRYSYSEDGISLLYSM